MTRLALALLALVLSGCASMSGKPPVQTISVQTVKDHKEVTDAGCIIKNGAGRWFVTTPGRVTINKNVDDLTVECSKEDVGSGREVIASKANMGMWGNAVFGGPVGYLIDRKSGAGYDYPQTVVVELKKEASRNTNDQGADAHDTSPPGQAEQQMTVTIVQPQAPEPEVAAPQPTAAEASTPPTVASPAAAPAPASSAPVWTLSPAPEQMAAPAPVAQATQPPVAAQPRSGPTQTGQARPAWQTPSPEPGTHYYQPY